MTKGKRNSAGSGPLGGRDAAVRAVEDVLAGRRFVHETLTLLRGGGQLEGREAGLAMEIALGAVRHAVTIETVLGAVARYDQRRVKPAFLAALALQDGGHSHGFHPFQKFRAVLLGQHVIQQAAQQGDIGPQRAFLLGYFDSA